jgi:hypothetical protein
MSFPLHEALAGFFTADPRKRVPASRVAELLGITSDVFRSMLDGEGGRRCTSTLTWAEAAAYLFDAWPRAQLLDTLGPDCSHRIPHDFHPTRVAWSIPIFVVQAMEHQAAVEWSRDPRGIPPNHMAARGVHDYVTDLLYTRFSPKRSPLSATMPLSSPRTTSPVTTDTPRPTRRWKSLTCRKARPTFS